MNFKPLGKRVLIERIEEESKTKTGIIIPDNAKEKPLSGIVKAVSKNKEITDQISVGDKIVFAKYSGTEISLDGKEYLVMNIDDVLGTL